MKTEAFLLCDAATDSQGKLNILGAFDSIFAREMPVAHRLCAVALRMRFAGTETGDHKIKISIIDADGKSIIPDMDGNIGIKTNDETASRAVNLILNIQGLKLQKFGEYRIDAAINGRHEASLPFYVRKMKIP